MNARRAFAELLDRLKRRCGRKYAALARETGYNVSNLCAIVHERRGPPRERAKLERIAAAFGVETGSMDEIEFKITAEQALSPWDDETTRSAHDRLHVRMRQLLRTADVPLTADQELQLARVHAELQVLLPRLKQIEHVMQQLEKARDHIRGKQTQLQFLEPPEAQDGPAA